jgi:hypothetical protein
LDIYFIPRYFFRILPFTKASSCAFVLPLLCSLAVLISPSNAFVSLRLIERCYSSLNKIRICFTSRCFWNGFR